jgi:hypothetical protein
MNIKNKFFKLFVSLVVIAGLTTACNGGGENNTDATDTTATNDNSNTNTLLAIDGQVFIIPSPVQTALLIKSVGVEYNSALLSNPKSATNFSTNFKKSINVGIYGADLGYVTIYDQTQDAISFLTAVKALGDELGVSSAFDKSLMERFEKNLGKQDSLLSLVSDAYRSADAYLKDSERNDVGSLILAGGWLESVHFATNVAKTSKNPEIIRRIGEQKSTLENLIKLLTPHYSKPEYAEFIDGLMDLSNVFEGVEFSYTYEKPVTEADKKLTTITSKSEVKISDEQLEQITKKIGDLRNKLIN